MAEAGYSQATTDGQRYGLKERMAGFLTLSRPIFFILTPLNAASAVVLALRGFPSWQQCIVGFFSVALAGCSVNIFNDYIDRRRDESIWPGRALPSGRVKPVEALAIVIAAIAASLSLAWFYFNPPTFFILLLAIVLGLLYSAYLRDRAGYLSLPPIIGLIYLGGWAAVAPQTLFTGWLPWYLYILGVVWQAAHIMVYYPLHIVKDSGDKNKEAPPALFFKPSARGAVGIGVAFTFITLLMAAGLFSIANLGLLYLFLVAAVGIYALLSSLRLLGDATSRQLGIRAFMSLSLLRLTISAAILLIFFIALF